MRPLLVTAHRGSSGSAPENTLAALRQAVLDGADLAEVDVQATADGELVLFHDESLARTAGDPRCLWQVPYAELAVLDAGSWFGPQFAGEAIPRLQDAIAFAQGQLRLNLEIKSYDPNPEFKARLARWVVEQVQTFKIGADCILTTFDLELLWHLHQQQPSLTLGHIQTAAPKTVDDWIEVYSLRADSVTPEQVQLLQAQQKAVHLWTVNQPKQMQQLLSWGVESLITDYPRRLRQVIAATR